MDESIKTLASLVGVTVVVAGVLWAAALWHASKHFASRKDIEGLVTRGELDGWGSRVNALETVVINARDSADAATDRVALMEERVRQQWERTLETIDRIGHTMEQVSAEQRAISREQAAMAANMKHVFKRLDS